ncbi:hypothetical protein AO411_2029955 [Salmonella enterica subsp. enterica serovar Sarajane]|nr:hypothetical protein AO411_2029955 [Salmonella enterica subsp. enterica serovar Sarajane]
MKYLTDILITLIVVALLAVGTGLNIEGFTATAHGMLWVCTVLFILGSVLPDMSGQIKEGYANRPLLWMVYTWISDLAFVAAAAWLNWYVLAVCLLFTLIIKQSFRHCQETQREEQDA